MEKIFNSVVLLLFSLIVIVTCGPEDRFVKGSCKVTEEFKDDNIGTIKLDQDLYCTKESFTSRVGVTCCHPVSPKESGVRFFLYCKNNPDGKEIDWKGDEKAAMESKSRIWFLVHGWYETPRDWANKLADVILKNDEESAVIVVDWSGKPLKEGWFFFQSLADLRTYGAMIGYSIKKWDIAERTGIAGQSMGAQVIGEAARWLKKNTEDEDMIDHCVGLDPCGPGFDGAKKDRRLDKGDCKLVEVIHSNSGPTDFESMDDMSLGTSQKSGNCDYWINCGSDQDCGKKATFKDMIYNDGSPNREYIEELNPKAFCSHTRAPAVLISAVKDSCDYKVKECKDCEKGEKKFNECSIGDVVDGRSLPPWSHCSPNDNVNYYVSSQKDEPHCN